MVCHICWTKMLSDLGGTDEFFFGEDVTEEEEKKL